MMNTTPMLKVSEHLISSATYFDSIASFLKRFGLEANAAFEIAPLAAQILIAVLTAAFAWVMIYRWQKRAFSENRSIERADFLNSLELEYESILIENCISKFVVHNSASILYKTSGTLEFALSKDFVWETSSGFSENGDRCYKNIKGHRFIKVNDSHYINTMTLHKVISWFKRVKSGVDAKIITHRDVADMWRYILPWAKDNRYSFMMKFFSVSNRNDKYDMAINAAELWYKNQGILEVFFMRILFQRVTEHIYIFIDCFNVIKRPDISKVPRDVLPILSLVNITLSVSLRERNVEILDYIGLINGPHEMDSTGIDRMVASDLLKCHLDPQEPTNPTD
ncbi:MAG: hypothetical protein ACXIVO_11440 [Glycocaulis sp.]